MASNAFLDLFLLIIGIQNTLIPGCFFNSPHVVKQKELLMMGIAACSQQQALARYEKGKIHSFLKSWTFLMTTEQTFSLSQPLAANQRGFK